MASLRYATVELGFTSTAIGGSEVVVVVEDEDGRDRSDVEDSAGAKCVRRVRGVISVPISFHSPVEGGTNWMALVSFALRAKCSQNG
jgi:hypothetical protein